MSLFVAEPKTFASAHEFLCELRPTHDNWQSPDPTYTGWIFRGQPCSTHRLIPSAFRSPPHPVLQTYRRIYRQRYMIDRGYDRERLYAWVQPGVAMDDSPQAQAALEDAALAALAQAALLRDFMLLADFVGHPAKRPDFLWHLEGSDQEPSSLSRFFNGNVPWDEVASFAIAQHHGIPTGLLDWTYNPLVAAFFAAQDYAAPKDSTAGKYMSVWGLRTSVFRTELKELMRITVEPGKVPFLDAQRGLFTWNSLGFHFLSTGQSPAVDDVVRQLAADGRIRASTRSPIMRELRLPISEGPHLLSLLWRDRVTRAHLMPTFDNVAHSLQVRVHLQYPWAIG